MFFPVYVGFDAEQFRQAVRRAGAHRTPEDLAAAKSAGADDAARTFTRAPDHPLLRVAWAQGFGETNQLRKAVQQAKRAGATWREIGEALGENPATCETKYGTGLERMRRYRARRRGEG